MSEPFDASDTDAALQYHIESLHSKALVTLDISGFLAGRKGHGAWEKARVAGSAPRELATTKEPSQPSLW